MINKALTMLFLALFALGCREKSVKSEKQTATPNIIFIMADDHAMQAISAYGHPLSHLAPTPNIDRLAKWTYYI